MQRRLHADDLSRSLRAPSHVFLHEIHPGNDDGGPFAIDARDHAALSAVSTLGDDDPVASADVPRFPGDGVSENLLEFVRRFAKRGGHGENLRGPSVVSDAVRSRARAREGRSA